MDTLAARQQMVGQQVRTTEVLDPRVLDVMARVPREAFVPPAYRELAFADSPIPIGFGQTMLSPTLQGRILQALGISPGDTALEVGAGTGYLSACIGLLSTAARSIEIVPELTRAAITNLRSVAAVAGAGTERVIVDTRDAFDGTDLGQYDAIALTGSLPVYDTRFERALRVGGRLFAVIGEAPVMDAVLIRRVGAEEWTRESLFETSIDALQSVTAAPRFVF